MSAGGPTVSFDRLREGRSVRVRVARAALEAALEVSGVLGSDPGPSGGRVTADPASGSLIGVLATAQSDGRYAVDLSLVVDMVPLLALAEAVRARVRRRVEGEQLGDVLGAVNVEFVSVVTAEEFAVAAAEQQHRAAGAAIVEEGGEAGARGSGSVEAKAAEAGAPARAGVGLEGERRVGAAAAEPGLGGRDAAAAALAARQAALATDQAALAAKQAALAAELAALAGERAALVASGAAVPSLGSEPAGAVVEDGERER